MSKAQAVDVNIVPANDAPVGQAAIVEVPVDSTVPFSLHVVDMDSDDTVTLTIAAVPNTASITTESGVPVEVGTVLVAVNQSGKGCAAEEEVALSPLDREEEEGL